MGQTRNGHRQERLTLSWLFLLSLASTHAHPPVTERFPKEKPEFSEVQLCACDCALNETGGSLYLCAGNPSSEVVVLNEGEKAFFCRRPLWPQYTPNGELKSIIEGDPSTYFLAGTEKAAKEETCAALYEGRACGGYSSSKKAGGYFPEDPFSRRGLWFLKEVNNHTEAKQGQLPGSFRHCRSLTTIEWTKISVRDLDVKLNGSR